MGCHGNSFSKICRGKRTGIKMTDRTKGWLLMSPKILLITFFTVGIPGYSIWWLFSDKVNQLPILSFMGFMCTLLSIVAVSILLICYCFMLYDEGVALLISAEAKEKYKV